MKARIYFGKGLWWCTRLGVTGCGSTPGEAWADMWSLYGGFIMRSRPIVQASPRRG